MDRGISKFEINNNGHLLYHDSNLEKMRKMFLDRKLINGALLGPGDPGDFDLGAWHVLCHLAGGCAVYRKSGKFLWVEISHIPDVDLYTATVTVEVCDEPVSTFPLHSSEGSALLEKAELVGFVEGSSLGNISAKDVTDNEIIFNKWKRQDFNLDPDSKSDGGRVWEHWCTVRDITPNARIGLSVLKAYLAMVSFCGGRLTSLVARGRKQYHHPEQLTALVKYGFISKEDALLEITPKPIPGNEEFLIYTANPQKCVQAAKLLPWDEHDIAYFMFSRRIDKWNTTNKVRSDLQKAKLI